MTTPTDEIVRTLDLHCYTDGTDTVVAESLEDASVVWVEHIGGTDPREPDDDPFVQIPDEKPITINMIEGDCGDYGCTVPNGGRDDEHMAKCPYATPCKTAAEWARRNGRGFLCSTEY